jgi:hypothetical protein
MIEAYYTLQLECDECGVYAEYSSYKKENTRVEARRDGWLLEEPIGDGGKTLCRRCQNSFESMEYIYTVRCIKCNAIEKFNSIKSASEAISKAYNAGWRVEEESCHCKNCK